MLRSSGRKPAMVLRSVQLYPLSRFLHRRGTGCAARRTRSTRSGGTETAVTAAAPAVSDRSTIVPARSAHHLVASTQRWLDRVVIGGKLCPFAPPVVAANTLRIVASTATNEAEAVADVGREVNLLPLRSDGNDNAHESPNTATVLTKNSPHHETTLIVFDAPFVRDFRSFVRLSWTLQEVVVLDRGIVDEVQLVLFHPQATHQTYSSDGDVDTAAADYSMRSPYPVVHLLREVDVMRAVTGGYPNLEDLPERNKQRLLADGLSVCRTRLDGCYADQ